MILWGLTVKLSWIRILNRNTSLFLGETWENRGLNLRFEAIALQPSFYPRSFVRRGGNCTERMENGQYEIWAMERRSIVADPFWNFRNTIFSMVWHATDNYGAVLWWELQICRNFCSGYEIWANLISMESLLNFPHDKKWKSSKFLMEQPS